MTAPNSIMDAGQMIHYHHEVADPLYVWNINLATYPNKHAGCHWHGEMEFIYIVSGRMNFFVSGEKMLLGQGDSLFINAGQLHYGYSVQDQPCQYICLLFHPSIFSDHGALKREYLDPLGRDEGFAFYLALAETQTGIQIGTALQQIWRINQTREYGCQLDILGLLLPLLAMMIREQRKHLPAFLPNAEQLSKQKQMLIYIAEHYAQNITVDQIAFSAGLEKKKCNDLFLKYLGQSAQKYLIAYRLEASGNLLIQTEKSIAEICALSGFHHPSYYGKKFELAYGCTPSDYRKKMKGE